MRRNRPSNVDLPEVPDNLQAKYLQVPPRGEPITYQNLISASYQVARGMEFLAQKKVNFLSYVCRPQFANLPTYMAYLSTDLCGPLVFLNAAHLSSLMRPSYLP